MITILGIYFVASVAVFIVAGIVLLRETGRNKFRLQRTGEWDMRFTVYAADHVPQVRSVDKGRRIKPRGPYLCP
jgi:hypothetical protein